MRPGRLDLELLKIRVGIQKLLVIADAVIVDPGAGARIACGDAGLPIDQPTQMRLPGPAPTLGALAAKAHITPLVLGK